MPVSEQTKRVMTLLKQGRVISIMSAPTRRLADARGLILLSQLVYWTTRDRNASKADGWFAKSMRDLALETGLSPSYTASRLSRLRERRLVKVWQRASKTAPWFKVDLQELFALCRGEPAEAGIDLPRFAEDADYRCGIVGAPLPYYRLLADLAGGDALLGLFLSRCVYWQEALESRNRLNEGKPSWGWSPNDWGNDIGISAAQLQILLKQAEKLALIEVTNTRERPFPGMWVDMERLAAAIKAINVPISVGLVRLECKPATNDPSTLLTDHLWPHMGADVNPGKSVHREIQGGESTKSNVRFRPPPGESGGPEPGFAESKHVFLPSTRARIEDYKDCEDYEETTTTSTAGVNSTGSVVVVSVQDQPNLELIYPQGLSVSELDSLRLLIADALPHRRQPLLDELSERMRSCRRESYQVRNPVAYLGYLIREDAKAGGRLVLECAHVAVQRRRREAELAQRRPIPSVSEQPAPSVEDPEIVRSRVAAAKAALRGQDKPCEKEETPA